MFDTQEECIALLEQLRWNGKPQCPYCYSIKATHLRRELRYHCNNCFTSYSVMVGTLFHQTHVELSKWFLAISLAIEKSCAISVRRLAIEINVNRNTAAYMLKRIRTATQNESILLKKLLIALKASED